MADFNKAIEYVLANEGGHYEDKTSGEVSNFGISLRWLQTVQPKATADDIRGMTKHAAISLYSHYWWTPNKLDLIPSDAVATKLFDAMVNCGAETAIEIFQKTLNEPLMDNEEKVAVDGHIGPQTAKAVAQELTVQNGEKDLLNAFLVNLIEHYEAIAAARPDLAKNLPGWEARAEKLPVA